MDRLRLTAPPYISLAIVLLLTACGADDEKIKADMEEAQKIAKEMTAKIESMGEHPNDDQIRELFPLTHATYGGYTIQGKESSVRDDALKLLRRNRDAAARVALTDLDALAPTLPRGTLDEDTAIKVRQPLEFLFTLVTEVDFQSNVLAMIHIEGKDHPQQLGYISSSRHGPGETVLADAEGLPVIIDFLRDKLANAQSSNPAARLIQQSYGH